MKALLLAAGMGTRLRPLTNYIPKCLAPINGKPLLEIWLETLAPLDFEEIIINTHYLPEQVEKFVFHSKYKEIIRLEYEPELLGTAGSLNKYLPNLTNDFFLAHADNYSIFNVVDFYQHHIANSFKYPGTMMTFNCDLPQNCGIVTTGPENEVLGYVEKPTISISKIANAAVYFFSKKIFEDDLIKSCFDFSKEFVSQKYTQFSTWQNSEYHKDIGSLETFALAQIRK